MSEEKLPPDYNQNNPIPGLHDKMVQKAKRSAVAVDELTAAALSQAGRWKKLLELLQYVEMSEEEERVFEAAIAGAAADRLEGKSTASILPFIVKRLQVGSGASEAGGVSGDSGLVPAFADAPRSTFRGVHKDGDPYEFLMASYGPWLRAGMECLDRPTLGEFDPILLKAIQQKASRNPGKMPALSDIFPSTSVARRNQLDYMFGKAV